MKLFSWNVNGIRAVLGKGFGEFLATYQPDILCLQEVRAHQEQVACDFPGYEIHWNAAEKKGYSGTAILTRRSPLTVSKGIGLKQHDNEGRVLTAEFPEFFLVNVYTPNSQRDLARLDYRVKEWDRAFHCYLVRLEEAKPVIFCGDLNVAHKEIDLANPKSNKRNAGFTMEERESFDGYVNHGFIDTFREFEKGGGHYTWWSQMPGIREKNIGWRIDYICMSQPLRPHLKHAAIHPTVFGSDHCPVSVHLDFQLRGHMT